jgi:hypothetical protein
MALTKVSYSMIEGACVNVLDLGAVADAGVTTGTDNTAAFTAAIAATEASGQALYIPAGKYFFNGGKLTISNQMIVCGDGIGNTVLMFGGSPSKEQITRIVWRAEYDVGDYTSNSDAAVAWGIRVLDQNVTLANFSVITNQDPNTNYPLPFNSATDYPTSDYNYGVIVQRANAVLQSISVSGLWATTATALDGSIVGGIDDGFGAYDCEFFGQFGFQITGAQGQPVSGDEYLTLTSLDTRTAAGISDVNVIGCNIGDTSCGLRLFINNVLKGVRRSTTGGGLYINGQLFPNSAKRIQGIRFFNCRFASSDPFVYKVNYANRVEFYACHSEFRSGFFNTDGVTAITAANCAIVVTEYARRIIYVGGEKSGETDDRVFIDTTANVQIIDELGFDDPNPPGSIPAARMFTVDALRDRGVTTGVLSATNLIGTGGGSAVGTFTSTYFKIGNMVTEVIKIEVTGVGTIAGNLSVDLRYTISNLYTNDYDVPVIVTASNTTLGDAGVTGLISNNTTVIDLYKVRSGAALLRLAAADLTSSSIIFIQATYMTEDA